MLESRRIAQQREQEEAIAAAKQAAQDAELRKRLEIERICNEDPSLRALESKLNMARISKIRDRQIAEKSSAMQAQEAEAAQLAAAIEADRRRAQQEESLKAEARREAAAAAKRDIELQLEERMRRDFFAGEEKAAKERAMVDAILARIREEDAADSAQRAAARAETARAIEAFKVEREAAVAAARAEEKAEEERHRQHAEQSAARVAAVEAKKGQADAIRDAAYRVIVEEREVVRARQEEEDALR